MATLVIFLIVGSYAVLGIWAIAVAVIVVKSCLCEGVHQAWQIARRFAIAAAPALITTIGFIAIFATFDPLWPAQDANATQIESFNRARDLADRVYLGLSFMHIITTAWSTKLFWRVVRRERAPQ